MAVDLSNYTDTLRREVSPPGSTIFSAVSDDVFLGYLADAFWEVKLDGFNIPWTCSVDGIVTPVTGPAPDPQVDPPVTPFEPGVDIPRDQIALVILYAGIKILRNQLMNSQTRLTAKAGPVEYSTESSANLLTTMLTTLNDVRNRLLALKTFNQNVTLIDVFSGRSISGASYAGYLYDWYFGAFGADVGELWSAGAYEVLDIP